MSDEHHWSRNVGWKSDKYHFIKDFFLKFASKVHMTECCLKDRGTGVPFSKML